MLKLKLTKAELDPLPDSIKAEYKAVGDTFILDTDVVFEDTTGLKSALQHEKDARKLATTKIKELETANTDLTARAGGVGDIEKSWQKKLDDAIKAKDAHIERTTAQLKTILVDDAAAALAKEISIAPDLLLPHIKGRLTLEEQEDGRFITRVLDREGKRSASSVNDLRAEIVADKTYAPIITASQASGGGAKGGGGGSAGGKSLKDMTETEMVAERAKDPAAFDARVAASQTV